MVNCLRGNKNVSGTFNGVEIFKSGDVAALRSWGAPILEIVSNSRCRLVFHHSHDTPDPPICLPVQNCAVRHWRATVTYGYRDPPGIAS